MNRLPDDDTLAALIRFGFRRSDIADRFEVTMSAVSKRAKHLGFPPSDPVCSARGAHRTLITARVFLSHLRAA
jgi:hypothetical protein